MKGITCDLCGKLEEQTRLGYITMSIGELTNIYEICASCWYKYHNMLSKEFLETDDKLFKKFYGEK